jgi:hypothetical protein
VELVARLTSVGLVFSPSLTQVPLEADWGCGGVCKGRCMLRAETAVGVVQSTAAQLDGVDAASLDSNDFHFRGTIEVRPQPVA